MHVQLHLRGRSLTSRGMRPLDSTRQAPIALVRSSLPSQMMTENRSASDELRDSHEHPSRSGTLQLLVQPASANSATGADQSSLLHNVERSLDLRCPDIMHSDVIHHVLAMASAPDRIRTCDQRIRSPWLYPSELQRHYDESSPKRRSKGVQEELLSPSSQIWSRTSLYALCAVWDSRMLHICLLWKEYEER